MKSVETKIGLFLADGKLTKCPMCGTARNSSAETCSYCGYIFEDNLGSSNPPSFSPSSRSMGAITETENVGPHVSNSSFESRNETLLKRMDNVLFRNGRSVQEGVLILTSQRLVFAPGNAEAGDEGTQNTLKKPDAYSVPLEQLANVSGNRGILRPSLKVAWHVEAGDSAITKIEFVQRNGPRTLEDVKSAISEWVPLIDQAARSEIELPELQNETPPQPAVNEADLRTHVLEELDDKHWKGFFQISRDLNDKYGINVDPDALENLCKKLVKEKLIEEDKHSEFFRRVPTKKN